MSHVDDGRLDALLDGAIENAPDRVALEAHLASCADCRARLDEARRLKQRAEGVLRAARPREVAPPSFEDMIASRRPAAAAVPAATPDGNAPASAAGTRAATTFRRPIHRLPLAWAATLVLAIGGGWMARELLRSDSEYSIQAPPMEAPRDQAMDAVSQKAETSEEAARQTGAVSLPATPAPVVGNAPAARAERRAFADDDPAKDEAKKAEPIRAKTLAAPPPVANALAGAAPPAVSAVGRADAGADLRDATLSEMSLRREAEIASLDVIRTGDASVESVARLVSDYSAATGNSGWTTVTVAEAASRLGRPLLTIPGLDVESVQVAAGAGGTIVRVMQRIGAATVAEVIQRPEAVASQASAARENAAAAPRRPAAESALPPASDLFRGRTLLSATRPGVLLVVAAPVPADSLRALSQRVR